MELKKKYAFISYSHKDERIAKWLQRRLEQYRLPSEIINDCEKTRYLRPIFRDRTDLNVGVLNEEIKRNLEASKYLIVLCSPNSASSHWVNEEVRVFIGMGRMEYIIPVLVGKYDTSCIPLALLDYYKEYPDRELLTVNIEEEGRECALIRIISKMLGLEYDILWDRHKRLLRNRTRIISAIAAVVLFLIYWLALPVSLNVILMDTEHSLPMPDSGVVMIGESQYVVESLDTTIRVSGIPGYKKCTPIPIRFSAVYYDGIQTAFELGAGLSNNVELHLSRDTSFSEYSGNVYDSDGNAIEGALVQIDNEKSYTDMAGHFRIAFPSHLQSETKEIFITGAGYLDFHREDECPGKHLGYILKRTNKK